MKKTFGFFAIAMLALVGNTYAADAAPLPAHNVAINMNVVLQTPPADVNNPTAVQFTASPDHAQLTRYDLDIVSPSNTVIQTLNLAKPTPDAQNTITVALNVQPVAFGNGYTVRVRAVAGTASSTDAVSLNKFNRTPLSVSGVTLKQ